MSHWTFNNLPVERLDQLPGHAGLEGFVYRITCLETGMFYIGKKSFHAATKKRVSKTEILKTKTRKRIIRGRRESDWKKYWSSSKELQADVKRLGPEKFSCEILELCCTKKYLNYAEVYWQMRLEVLKVPSYNGNILGKYYHRDMLNCPDEAASTENESDTPNPKKDD
jgi:hypothetical protein